MRNIPVISLLIMIFVFTAAGESRGQISVPDTERYEKMGITERLGEFIPLELSFTDESGREVVLKDYFDKGRPVMLSLNFFQCPMLCHLQLDGAVDVLRLLDFTPGTQFEFITLSFNPRETTALARLWKQEYLKKLGKPEAAKGWHFLTGRREAIKELTRAVGFEYRYVKEDDTYEHPAALILFTPDGRISRYLTGVLYEPKTLRLSLVEASEGKIGSPLDQFILYCFHYDAGEGRYTLAAMNIMRAGGVFTALILGIAITSLFLRERRGRRKRKEHPNG